MARSRTFSQAYTGYSIDLYTNNTSASNMEIQKSTCTDVPGPGDCKDLDINHVLKGGGLIWGTSTKKISSWVKYLGYPVTAQGSDSFYKTHLTSLPARSDGVDATTALSRTNPNRSSIDSLVSMYELRELPALVKDVGGQRLEILWKNIPKSKFKFMKRAAQINLIVQFGIAPIIGDVSKLLQFTSLVDQRVKELDKLRTRGLRRTVTISKDSVTQDFPSNTVHSSVVTLGCGIRKVTTRTVRGHVRWYPQDNLKLSDSDMRSVAARIVAGGVIDASTLWEALPWTWLIDYFSNVGDVLAASRNIVPVVHDPPVIMVETITEISSYNESTASSGKVSFTPIRNKVITRTRRTAVPTLEAHMPLLTEKQMSILGSLAVTRL